METLAKFGVSLRSSIGPNSCMDGVRQLLPLEASQLRLPFHRRGMNGSSSL